jgi:hypothetical protein
MGAATTRNRYKPSPRECALLFLRLVEEREERRGKAVTRLRLSETTLMRLWNRKRLTVELLQEIDEWLLTAGWVLISGASTFGAVKEEAIGNWPRISTSQIGKTLEQVVKGVFDFGELEHLLVTSVSSAHDGDEASTEPHDDDGKSA